MKLIILVLLSITLAYASPISNNVDFDSYMAQYQKSYSNPAEKQMRQAIYDSNVNKINQYNQWAEANGLDSRLGVTIFTDLDYSEFIHKYTGYVPSGSVYSNFKVADQIFTPKAVASSWDWRAQGKVNAIKNQGQCGSCWTFSITAIAEIGYAIKNNNLVTLSEQELLDCAPNTSGCSGADPADAAVYLLNSGSELNSSYPYKAVKSSSCGYISSKVVAKPKAGYRWIGTESNLKTIVSQTGAVAIAIYVSDVFKNFKSTGILSDPACVNPKSVNHAVTIVGYGTLNGKDYWLVRNQWGTNWGDAGYIKLPLGSNYCGLMTEPIYFTY